MEKGFRPTPSAEGWQLSTPSPILYASLRAALELYEKAGYQNCLEKAGKMAAYLRQLVDEILTDQPGKFEILTPSEPADRGCQLSLLVKNNGRALFDELTRQGIFADWREPNVIRVAPVPLYNSYEEIWRFAQVLGS